MTSPSSIFFCFFCQISQHAFSATLFHTELTKMELFSTNQVIAEKAAFFMEVAEKVSQKLSNKMIKKAFETYAHNSLWFFYFLVLSLYPRHPFRYRLQSKMGDSGEEQAIKDLGRIPSWKAENPGKLLPANRNTIWFKRILWQFRAGKRNIRENSRLHKVTYSRV